MIGQSSHPVELSEEVDSTKTNPRRRDSLQPVVAIVLKDGRFKERTPRFATEEIY
jgi:hypothetical protein